MPAQIHQLDFNEGHENYGTSENSAFLREALRLLAQSFIEFEVTAFIEAHPYERSDSRRTLRNGYRQRSWRTGLGEITLFIPKLRKGSYTPTILKALRHSEEALIDAAQAAAAGNVSRSDLEQLANRAGVSPLHGSQLAELEEQLHDLAQRYRFHTVSVIESDTPIASLRGTITPVRQGWSGSNILALSA